MRSISIMGRLGGDPEIKSTKEGKTFCTFRLASQENNEQNTSWYSVSVWENGLQNFCKFLKKGSAIIVKGDYSDRIYQSKTGVWEIGRDIRAHAIYFTMSTPKNDDSTVTTTQQPQPQVVTVPQPQPQVVAVSQPLIQSVAVPQAQPQPVTEDDLPF